jgi:hypothetical protein
MSREFKIVLAVIVFVAALLVWFAPNGQPSLAEVGEELNKTGRILVIPLVVLLIATITRRFRRAIESSNGQETDDANEAASDIRTRIAVAYGWLIWAGAQYFNGALSRARVLANVPDPLLRNEVTIELVVSLLLLMGAIGALIAMYRRKRIAPALFAVFVLLAFTAAGLKWIWGMSAIRSGRPILGVGLEATLGSVIVGALCIPYVLSRKMQAVCDK